MDTQLSPFTAAVIGAVLWLVLLIVALILTFGKKRFSINDKIVMFSWDLVKIFGGMLFAFLLGGAK